jgi:type II secretory pathway predicted ATPase ExeA
MGNGRSVISSGGQHSLKILPELKTANEFWPICSREGLESPISIEISECCPLLAPGRSILMSAYLKFFELEQSPFEGKAQSKVVLGTRALRDAFAAIRDGLSEGSARICVNGGPGLGKTSLARSLPKLLGDTARVAVVLDPSIPWESLRGAIAKQWGLESEGLARAGLLEAARDTRLVMVVDRAEQATEDFLDHLDIMLSVRSETDEPAVQSVLLACLSNREAQPSPLIWWLDRIQTLQLEFAPIPREGVESYIHKHLKRAGWRGERIFGAEASMAIHGVTGGIPGDISRLCERLLAQAAEADLHEIDAAFVQSALDETSDGEPEAESTLEDDFDELVHEEKFEGASSEADEDPGHDASDGDHPTEGEDAEEETVEAEDGSTIQSLTRALEHFDQEWEDSEESNAADVAEDSDESDESEVVEPDHDGPIDSSIEAAQDTEDTIDAADVDSLILLEDYLGAPATPEELRAIRRGAWRHRLRAAAAVAAAILVVAGAFAWLGGDSDSRPPSQNTNTRGPGASQNGPDGKVLARLRGPVAAIDTSPASTATPFDGESVRRPGPAEPKTAQMISPGNAHQASTRDLRPEDASSDDADEVFEADDFVDMRPASMRPDALAKPDVEEPFW